MGPGNMKSGASTTGGQPARRFHAITFDPCEHAASLPAWSQEYVQLAGGLFSGEIAEATFGPVQIFQERIEQIVDEKANPRRDSFTFGVPIDVGANGRWQGHELTKRSIMRLHPNEELYFTTPKHSNILVTVIESGAFDNLFENDGITTADRIPDGPQVVEVKDDVAARFRAALETTLSVAINQPTLLKHEAVRNDLSDYVIHSVLAAVQSDAGFDPRLLSRRSVQRLIVERARAYVLANRERAVSVADLCAHLQMSRRGVHHAFVNVIGINPVTFLRYVRLHEVRKSLLHLERHDTISSLAADWGFWHMGMFGQQYKQLFCETPSETMSRARTEGYVIKEPLSNPRAVEH